MWSGTTVLGVNVVEQSPGVGVMWSGAISARLRPWSHDPECAFLLITSANTTGPHTTELEQWLNTARQWGYQRVRTSALPPSLSTPLLEVGFSEVQRLAVLSVAHHEAPSFRIPRDIAPRPLRVGHRPSRKLLDILHIDELSFPTPWNMAWPDMNDAMNATHHSRIFVSENKGTIEGFVLIGTSHNSGFLQRLAVHPSARRTGVASRLVAKSLEWSYRRGCSTTVVNTETTNDSALGLYASLGFQQLPDGLSVLECAL